MNDDFLPVFSSLPIFLDDNLFLIFSVRFGIKIVTELRMLIESEESRQPIFELIWWENFKIRLNLAFLGKDFLNHSDIG